MHFDQLLDVPILLFLFLHTLLLCHIYLFGFYHQGSNSLDPDQARHFVGPVLGPNRLQRLLADDKSPLVGKEYDTEQLLILLSSLTLG